ncbi:DpnI domain-containing protein [Pelagibius marinus]|uniref:DpnI domain-containing protein n=1 Tax=Pelagibius marinus TaxID=2762760 RepID=UPI001872D383|nr:DpnI domain-containing protein [Pelagibius marinus]
MTPRQGLGELGEKLVAKECSCPRCKRDKTLTRLPANFKCADLICDFCGYLAQVKATKQSDHERVPRQIPGAAWSVQKERMDAGIYFPLFLVVVNKDDPRAYSIFYLAADLQTSEMFKPRRPLSKTAKRAGWQGFMYDLTSVQSSFVRLRWLHK